jgi:hypothetical protein
MVKFAIIIPNIAPGISENNKGVSHLFQKLLTLIASAIINNGNIRVMASIAVNFNINRGTAKTPSAPAKADFEIPTSNTTKVMSKTADISIVLNSFVFIIV